MMAAVDGVKEGVTKKGLLVTLKCLSSKDWTHPNPLRKTGPILTPCTPY